MRERERESEGGIIPGRRSERHERERERERERDAVEEEQEAEGRGRDSMWRGGVILGLLIFCSAIVLTIIIISKRRRRRRWASSVMKEPVEEIRLAAVFPPGPPAWPVIGHLHLFSHQVLTALSRQYGPILGLRLGQQQAVVVSSPELAREVLTTHDKVFAHRPPFAFVSIMLFGRTSGIGFSHGPAWRKHRKICTLGLFTATRLHQLEHVRQQEMRALLLYILHQSCSGTSAIDLGRCVGQMSSRLLMRLLHSRPSVHICDENLQLLIREQEQELLPTIGDFIPSLSCLDFFRKQRMRRLHARLDKVFTQMLMERQQESTSLHDDLLHTLLSHDESLTMVEIKAILHEMIGGGIHTTALSLEWAMAELLKNPDCLCKLQREIDMQQGEKKQVTDADLPKLSYLKCVIKEAARLHPVAPLLVPRLSIEECKVQGYTIPAKTLMFVNVWAMGRDERVWPNANEFMPERFEDMDIDLRGQHFELLPFGSGRRICVGLPLAISVIEVTLANLVSYFDWELPCDQTHKSINMDEKVGIALNKATPVIVVPKPRVSTFDFPNM